MSRSNKGNFDIGTWCDFVRGLLDAEGAAEMRGHLDNSAEARRTVSALRRVEAVAEFDRRSGPPDWAVRSAKALGSLFRSQDSQQPSLFHRLAMSLSFDSLASPALAGTRDVQTHDRFLVFNTDSFRVDLRIEPEADLQGSVFVGQLLRTVGRADGAVEPLAEVPVLALRDGRIVGQAKTGPFGEFQADGLPVSNVSLRLLPDDDTCLEIEVGHNDPDGNHSGDSV